MAEQAFALEIAETTENEESNDIEWICKCFLCNLIARPIFRKFAKETLPKAGEVELEKQEEEASTVQGQVLQKTPSVEEPQKTTSFDVEVVVSKIVEELNKKVSSRVEVIEKEMENMKKDFGTIVEELKNAIIEVRATVSEVANPFNFMRKYAEIVDESGKLLQLLGQLQTQQQPQQDTQQILEHIAKAPVSEEIKMLLSAVTSSSRGQGSGRLARVLRLIKWVDENLTGIPREVLEELVSFIVKAGVISEKERDILVAAIRLIEDMRKKGIKVREQMIMIYAIARILGAEDREADNEVLKLIIDEHKLSLGGV